MTSRRETARRLALGDRVIADAAEARREAFAYLDDARAAHRRRTEAIERGAADPERVHALVIEISDALAQWTGGSGSMNTVLAAQRKLLEYLGCAP